MLRLLDDIPTLHYALTYGFNRQEPDQTIRWLGIIQMIIDVIYSPVETIAWAGAHKLITIDVELWDKTCTWFWIVSLYLSFMKSAKKYKNLLKHKSVISINSPTELKTIDKKLTNEILTCGRMLIDLSYAISYLPPGTLWGGKMITWQIGALGTVSSIISLYQSLSKRVPTKKCL
ncbi:peroxisomal membrane protein 11C [Fopius arisanus]|uniref:Peroxisomal membrane protein 11C n=1 Tax=Fopius arisanus TaxID=64838 RepID=A0A9R1U7D8_9HYME|nr:PREDICTED: peroxisomal membrane protein 11C [Fopius arisanus]